MKYCPYCLRLHNERGAACSDPICKRKVRNFRSAVSSGRRRALTRVQAGARARAEHAQGWRDVAMGRKAPEEMFNLDGKVKR